MRILKVSFRGDQQLDERLDVPSRLDEVEGESIEQFRMRRPHALRSEVLRCRDDAAAERGSERETDSGTERDTDAGIDTELELGTDIETDSEIEREAKATAKTKVNLKPAATFTALPRSPFLDQMRSLLATPRLRN